VAHTNFRPGAYDWADESHYGQACLSSECGGEHHEVDHESMKDIGRVRLDFEAFPNNAACGVQRGGVFDLASLAAYACCEYMDRAWMTPKTQPL
jgi:hypothetical protein